MCDEDNTDVLLRELFQPLPNDLCAHSGVLSGMGWMIPFLRTLCKVELRELRRQVCPRDALVTVGIVGFAQIRPDFHSGVEWGRAENGWKSVQGSLDCTGHGRDHDEIWDGGDLDFFGCIGSFICQGWVTVGVAAFDIVEGLAVADDVDKRSDSGFYSKCWRY